MDITFSSLYGKRRTLAFSYFVSSLSPPTLVGDNVDMISEGEKSGPYRHFNYSNLQVFNIMKDS